MADGCYGGAGAGAGAGAAGTATTVAAGRGGCGHVLSRRDGSVGGVGDGQRSWWLWTHLVALRW